MSSTARVRSDDKQIMGTSPPPPFSRAIICCNIHVSESVMTSESSSNKSKSQTNVKIRQAVNYKRNIEVHSPYYCCRGKAVSSTYSECVSVALVSQHATRMRCIVICGLSGFTMFFPHYLINGTILGKKLLHMKCVLIFSTLLSPPFLILRRIRRDIIIKVRT